MKNLLYILVRSPKFIVGLIILVLMLGFMWVYPLIDTDDPRAPRGLAFDPPTRELPLGTDNFGRDVILELAYGMRTSLYVGVVAGLTATLIGLTLGLIAGFKGGLTDNIINTITNMFIVIPPFIVLILISVSLQTRSVGVMAFVIGVTAWPWTARAVRAQTSSLRVRDHVNIARISGYGLPRLIIQSVLPYIASYVFMAFILQMASAILAEASLSMLGLGPNNTISLGLMLNWAMLFEGPMKGAWWSFVPVALIIGLITFALKLMNSGMDQVFNPKIRS